MKIDCKKDSINVGTKSGQVLMEGKLFNLIKPSEIIWNLMPGSHILITLEKYTEGPLWTKCLISEDNNLNQGSMDINQPYKNMSESDKMAVEYAYHKQTEKQENKEDLEKILKQAWNVEGSPFQGQPFDPTVISNIQK